MEFQTHKRTSIGQAHVPTPTARLAPAARGYDKEWFKTRWTIAKRRPPCASCGAAWQDGKTGHHIDHIVPFRGIDDPLRLDLSNLQALCHSCHSSKTCRQDGGFGN